jgi:hypothetical protein
MAQTWTDSRYKNTYTSFSGADIVATFTPRGGKPLVLGEIQTISYSTYRPTTPVYGLGMANPKGVVRGARTIAGSLIFTVFDRHVLSGMKDSMYSDMKESIEESYKSRGLDWSLAGFNGSISNMKTDEIPPFDISISFMNESGQSSKMTLYDVYIVSEGQTMSIEDMMTENTMQFLAMDIEHMVADYYEGE